jgi:hypothetical protein
MRVMPEGERQETLALLQRNRADVEAALAAMPIVVETAGAVSRRREGPRGTRMRHALEQLDANRDDSRQRVQRVLL